LLDSLLQEIHQQEAKEIKKQERQYQS